MKINSDSGLMPTLYEASLMAGMTQGWLRGPRGNERLVLCWKHSCQKAWGRERKVPPWSMTFMLLTRSTPDSPRGSAGSFGHGFSDAF